MHSKYWEDLIPFYVAGTLNWQESQQVEQHIRTCAECRQAVSEWQAIAGAVRAEAVANLTDLPPLAPMLRTLQTPQPIVPKRRSTVRRMVMPLTSAAAALMVIAFAVLLAANVLRPNIESTDIGAGLEGSTEEPTSAHTATPTADLMATIEALTTQHANGTAIPEIVDPLNFATNTPSREPVLPDITPTPTQTAEIVPPPDTPAPSVPIAVVMGDSINLREGPGINYPVVGSAQNGERFEIIARAGSGSNVWYVIRRGQNRTAWVYGAIVQIEPENAVISAAATIPAPPPTETPAPPTPTLTPSAEPTGSFFIRSGNWTLVTTVVEDTCGGEIGISTSEPHILIPSTDGVTVVFTDTQNGTSFVLTRDGGVNVYSSMYNVPTPEGNANVTVQIVFDANGTTYTGTEFVSYPNGCATRSLWAGRVG